MAVRELAPLSAKVLRDAFKRHMKRPDGSNYAVFDQLYNWIVSVNRLQDDTEAVDVQVKDVKRDFDNYRSNKVNPTLTDHENRISALENAPNNPFPA